jgi:LAO/AO transport system kinase
MADALDDPRELAAGLARGDRRALARAITLVEDERPESAPRAEQLLAAVLPRVGGALRLGVSGPPGVGKSTLIDALGRHAIAQGERVAVLAIDPSSPVAGGSILGDKTRMARLAGDPASFIRPSPSRGAAGGIGRHTQDAVALCEAAGYSLVVVETLGTGQGEHAVTALVDCSLLVVMPGAGDELQGMKRGAVEVADLVVVNKADGEQLRLAERAAADLEGALGLFARAAGEPVPRVLLASARDERGVPELWSAIATFVAGAKTSGTFARRRSAGAANELDRELELAVRELLATPALRTERVRLETELAAKKLTPRAAARQLLQKLGVSAPEIVGPPHSKRGAG